MSENQQPMPKVDPESLALRAPPKPVVRLSRRMLTVVAGGVAALVLGATIWSLQPQRRERTPATELYNVDRVAKPENLDQLPKDYSAIPAKPPSHVPVLGEPLPGDLGPAIVKAERASKASHNDAANAERIAQLRDAEEAAKSNVFFRASGGPRSAVVEGRSEPAANRESGKVGATAIPAHSTDPTAVQNRQH